MDAGDKECKSCGSPVRKLNRNWSKFATISVITLIIAAFGAYIVLYNLDIIGPDFFDDIFGGSSAVEEQIPPDAGYTNQEPDEVADSQGTEITTRRTPEEQQAILSTTLAAVEAYIRDFTPRNPIISSTGYLHNAALGEYITIELLVAQRHLDEEFLEENIMIFYLRPMDLVRFEEVVFDSIPTGQMGFMTVFLGYEIPTGIALYSRFGKQEIFRENLSELLLTDYNPNSNGEILRPTQHDTVYQAVVDMIQRELPQSEVFIRYLAVDNTHGFVAFSTAGNGHGIINYIFAIEDEEGFARFRVLAVGFENTQQPKVAINGAAPNFNFELMPNYDITSISLLSLDSSEFADVMEAMAMIHQIEGELPAFMSVTPFFAYLVYEQGNMFFGQNSNDGWNITPIGGWQVAEGILSENVAGNPPLYIIWQR